jgi:hypothetical protein
VDVQHAIAFINTINGAFVNARAILQINTRKCDYICHAVPPPVPIILPSRVARNVRPGAGESTQQ